MPPRVLLRIIFCQQTTVFYKTSLKSCADAFQKAGLLLCMGFLFFNAICRAETITTFKNELIDISLWMLKIAIVTLIIEIHILNFKKGFMC